MQGIELHESRLLSSNCANIIPMPPASNTVADAENMSCLPDVEKQRTIFPTANVASRLPRWQSLLKQKMQYYYTGG